MMILCIKSSSPRLKWQHDCLLKHWQKEEIQQQILQENYALNRIEAGWPTLLIYACQFSFLKIKLCLSLEQNSWEGPIQASFLSKEYCSFFFK